MPNVSLYAAIAAFAAALAALLVYHAAFVRPAMAGLRRLLDAHDGMIAGGAGGAADRLAGLAAGQAANRMAVEDVNGRIEHLEHLAASDVSRIGFVRYNALDDTGSDLSYALALLSREGDGVVLSSIYSRTDTRTYGKAVNRFEPAAKASDEELQAIARARALPSHS